jgi:hypothetical protein
MNLKIKDFSLRINLTKYLWHFIDISVLLHKLNYYFCRYLYRIATNENF